MAEFRDEVNNETTTNQEGREQVERVIQNMQEPDADTIAAVLGPETADPQPSSSGPIIPRERQTPKRRGGPEKSSMVANVQEVHTEGKRSQ